MECWAIYLQRSVTAMGLISSLMAKRFGNELRTHKLLRSLTSKVKKIVVGQGVKISFLISKYEFPNLSMAIAMFCENY